jgi:hypothetical protein
MTKICINGAEVHVKEYTHLDANNFIPRIRIQAISEINEKCRMLEFFAEDLDVNNLPDTIKIKMKYELALHDTASSIEIGQGKVTLIGDSFWYPRNLHQSENVAINIRTNDLGSAALNDQKLDFIQTGYLKEHKLDFVDGADDPHSITIFCPELE